MNLTTALVRIGRDSEVKTFENGNAVLNFSAVHSEKYMDSATGEKKEKNTWYEVAKWGKPETLNKIAQYYKKGAVILIQGVVSARAYLDKGANEPKASLVLTVRVMDIAKFAADSGAEAQSNTPGEAWKGQQPIGANFTPTSDEGFFKSDEQDDLPF